MNIKALGYVGIATANLSAWETFAADLLGMMVRKAEDADTLHLKMDDRAFRFVVQQSDVEAMSFVGWELANPGALDQAVTELTAAGHEVSEATGQEKAAREVRHLFRTLDPAGYTVELFSTPKLDHQPFVSPAGVSRFVTGDLGLGHVVLPSPDLQASLTFYTDVLGFRLSDQQRRGDGSSQAFFLHCNRRHHSLAVLGDLPAGLHHFMVETGSLDDVGYAFDRFLDAKVPIMKGIGKHTNDQMVSFYAQTPSGFGVEYGCGGVHVDDAQWSTAEITKSSFWGHRPVVY